MVESLRVNILQNTNFDRTRPLELQEYVTSQQWETLASAIDEVGEKGRKGRNLSYFAFAGCLIGMAFFMAGGSQMGRGFGRGPSPLIFIGMIIFIGSPILGMVLLFRTGSTWAQALRNIADETSKSIKNVTVHYEEERIPYISSTYNGSSHGIRTREKIQPYFKFSFSERDVENPVAVIAEPKIAVIAEPEITVIAEPEITIVHPYPTAPTQTTTKPARERLAELEKLKDVLSTEEYFEKRQEILSSI